jgi:hypothetical protein
MEPTIDPTPVPGTALVLRFAPRGARTAFCRNIDR